MFAASLLIPRFLDTLRRRLPPELAPSGSDGVGPRHTATARSLKRDEASLSVCVEPDLTRQSDHRQTERERKPAGGGPATDSAQIEHRRIHLCLIGVLSVAEQHRAGNFARELCRDCSCHPAEILGRVVFDDVGAENWSVERVNHREHIPDGQSARLSM